MIPFIISYFLLQTQPGQQVQCGFLPQSLATSLTANEPWYCPINNQIAQQWSSYLPIMVIVTLIAFMLAAVIFMAGLALQNPKIRNFGISEFYEACATAIIVGAFIYVCAVIFGLVPGTLVGAINPYATAFSLISSTINTAQAMYSSFYHVYLTWSIPTTVTVELDGFGSGLIRNFLGKFGVVPQIFINAYTVVAEIFVLQPAQAIGGLLVDGISLLYGEYYLLVFFASASIPVFLVPGVILRALPPTRSLGGVLIAMAIGFYLIMPTLFATVYYFTAPNIMRSMNSANGNLQSTINSTDSIAVTPQSPIVLSVENTQSSLNGFWLLILFYPAIIIALTYAFIEQIAQFIGGTYRSSSRLRRFI